MNTATTRNKFRTTSGRLTAYALACGYVERTDRQELGAHMYRAHGCYHVAGWDEKGERVTWSGRRLAEARCVLRACGPLRYVPTC